MAILSKGKTFTSGDQVTATGLNELVDNATFASGSVDNSTTQLSDGRIIVKDLGITSSKLNLSVNGASQNIAQFKTVQGSSARTLNIRTPASTSDLNSPFEITTGNAIQFIIDTDPAHTVTIDSNGKTLFGNGPIGVSDTPLSQVNINTDDALGGTSGDQQNILRLQENSSHEDNLLFTANRTADGSDWTTAAHRIQRKVNSTKMGYIQFGHYSATNGGLITFGEDETERMRIDAEGQVGIGTDAPSSILDITQASGAAEINLTATTSDAVLSLNSDTDEGQDSEIHFNAGTNTRGKIEYNHHATAASQKMSFFAGDNNERLTILGDGDVGIGTTSPDGNLHVVGATGDKGRIFLSDKDNGTGEADSLALVKDGVNASLVNRDGGYLQLGANNSYFVTLGTGGNVGIGEGNPDGKLHVGTGNNSDGTDIDIVIGGSSANSRQAIITKKIQSSDRALEIYASGNTSDEDIRFFTDTGTERMRIEAAGDVGIGTSSPSSKLEVVGDVRANNIVGREANNGILIKSDPESPDGTNGGSQIELYSQDFTSNRSQIFHEARYSTFQDLTPTDIVVIGDQSGTNTLKVIGNIQYTGTSTDISDSRLKENVEPLTGSLDKICQLEAKSYTMVDDEDKTEELGFIAQDVQQIFPNLVREHTNEEKPEGERGDPFLSVAYIQLIAPMVEAIKELKSENEALKTRVAALES